jgi:hypothetical protein
VLDTGGNAVLLMHAAAALGSYASVIGGNAAASVVFPREVRARAVVRSLDDGVGRRRCGPT